MEGGPGLERQTTACSTLNVKQFQGAGIHSLWAAQKTNYSYCIKFHISRAGLLITVICCSFPSISHVDPEQAPGASLFELKISFRPFLFLSLTSFQ